MSSSSDVAPQVSVLPRPDLRTGEWTRLGPGTLLGDAVTEHTLSGVAEQTRTAARAQGYAVGWAQGRREAAEAARIAAQAEATRLAAAEAEREARHREAVAALATAAEELRATLAGVAARIEEQATEVAWALTEELVGHEVRGATAADVVRRVLALAPTAPVERVRLHPRHLGDPALAELVDSGVRIVPDPAMGPADALVEIEDHVLDLRVAPAMARVREVLS